MSTSWVSRWGYEIANSTTKPGVYRLKEGGYLVRGKFGLRVLRDAALPEALAARVDLMTPRAAKSSQPLFATFAVSLLEEKILLKEIKSEATVERYKGTIEKYLVPHFAQLRVDEIEHQQCLDFKLKLARRIKKGGYAESTANGHLRILEQWINVMVTRFNLPRNPYMGVKPFPETSSYTEEEPNSLSPKQLKKWLAVAKRHYPQHFTMMILGFLTGRRPGELRAIRKVQDILWVTNQVLIRRSHSRKQTVKEHTKTGKDLKLDLPDYMMALLKEHIALVTNPPINPAGKPPLWWREAMRASELLFPSRKGGFQARSCLAKPFVKITKKAGITHHLSPRAMRRSYQDLARAAGVVDLVGRSISGHATEKMKDHYSTVRGSERLEAVTQMLKLVQ